VDLGDVLANIANMKDLGFNAVHLYAESFDPNYPTNGSTAPGYHMANRLTAIVRRREPTAFT
jgi:endoglucanase